MYKLKNLLSFTLCTHKRYSIVLTSTNNESKLQNHKIQNFIPRVLAYVSAIQLISRSPVPMSGAGTSIPGPGKLKRFPISGTSIAYKNFPSMLFYLQIIVIIGYYTFM